MARKQKTEAAARVELLKVLDTWVALNAATPRLQESDVGKLLAYERDTRNRLTFVLRLHARLNRLRRERERRELAAGCGFNVIYPPKEKR